MKDQVLKALREADGSISGQELSQRLGVSRTAVWKIVHQLIDEGYEIDAVNRKGYRLRTQPDVITRTEIESRIRPGCVGSKVFYFDEIVSTNDEAKLMAEKGEPHATLLVAESQTGGKGRRSHGWASPPGIGIWMSFILRPALEPTKASMLTLLAAMAVYDGIHALSIPCRIKWPNDIVIDGKKVCGILTEMSATPDDINYVVTGIGINVHNKEFPAEIADVAISLDMAKPADIQIRRAPLIADILTAFEGYYRDFLRDEDLSSIREEYNRRLVNNGKEIFIIEKKRTRSGMCRGIDDDGCLIAQIDGQEEHIMSGEVSVRGILGYV